MIGIFRPENVSYQHIEILLPKVSTRKCTTA